ncbi:hypothetical protein GIS00_03315 [Nakamurella sp. YIM 132087]|uniref:Uncharacterized protein n=1 Tax=Nakamurella alba TaxID=2665158 RepID=A0A7K1FJB1_9ACTN|nr:Rv3235 family protein [Nakamurella alba]MTD12974.1 hypothetical protein [Nakamurella alba]
MTTAFDLLDDYRPTAPYLAPVPVSLPPYDDELPLVRESRAPAVPRIVDDARVPTWSEDPDVGVRRNSADDLPAAAGAASVLARGLVETLCGVRPVAQLRQHCAPGVFAGLQRSRRTGTRMQVSSVRVSAPADGIAEASAVVRAGRRARALAFRMEGIDGRWRVTALQIGW